MLEQLAVNGIIAGSWYILLALSFGLIYGVTGTFHFAHGGVFALSGYLFYQLADVWQAPAIVAALVALLFSCLLGVAIEHYVYRPLRLAGASGMVIMLSSLGLFVVFQNVMVIGWGGLTLVAKVGGEALRQAVQVGSIWITPLQIVTLIVSLCCLGGLEWLLKFTRTGKAIRAVAADPEMTELVGIGGGRIALLVYVIGSGIAALAGMLAVADTGLLPSAGMSALLIAVIAVIVGGIGSMTGAAVGALIIGMAQNLGIWKLPSEWQEAIAFAVLVVFILWRPAGLFAARHSR